MKDNRVAVVDASEDVEAAVSRSVELLGGPGLEGGEHVIIKPSLCHAKNPHGMVITARAHMIEKKFSSRKYFCYLRIVNDSKFLDHDGSAG